ncbi:recombinase RecA [Alteromonas sp. ASW11-19]|uniref:Recombinase RecA n=1 Tax=Alteromonas salexigens TaxID=2982530 RepID=A0ABT2VNL0_9ALTE|nr:recombinase RecA [Alteromonas salexigens]MCU7554824.1 recombinase RecA [Alteromonas salexigens]
MTELLSEINKHPLIWRGRDTAAPSAKLATGHAILDRHLAGGLPSAGMVRVQSVAGIGELAVFKGVITGARQHKLCVFINPPGKVQSPWLRQFGLPLSQVFTVSCRPDEALWAAEQALKSGSCHCVLLWATTLSAKQARRLQVAASYNHALCLTFQADRIEAGLPVALDLRLVPHVHGLSIEIVKQQGRWTAREITIPLRHTPTNAAITRAMTGAHDKPQHLSSVG